MVDTALIGIVLLARAMWHTLCCTLDCPLSVAPGLVSWGGGQTLYTHLVDFQHTLSECLALLRVVKNEGSYAYGGTKVVPLGDADRRNVW